MKFTRTTYEGSPCWKLSGRWIYADADWNTRWPFGTSMCIRIGRQREVTHEPECEQDCHCDILLPTAPGFTLDLNAPLGEPNRLYLWGPKRNYMIGLLGWHEFRETHVEMARIGGREVPVHHGDHVRCRPRIVRGQAWDWKRSEGSDRWRWLVVHPNDQRERWERAHPQEAEAAKRRLAEYKARAAARKAAE